MGKNMENIQNLQNAIKTKDRDKIESAFEMFYINNYKLVCNLVKQYVNSSSDVEDIVSESFLTFFNNLNKLDFQQNPAGYFSVIIKNTTINYLKSKQMRNRNNCVFNNELIYNLSDSHQQNNIREIIEVIKEISDGVDVDIEIYRLVYRYRYKKIAHILNMNLNTVKSKHLRTMKKLKERIDQDDFS